MVYLCRPVIVVSTLPARLTMAHIPPLRLPQRPRIPGDVPFCSLDRVYDVVNFGVGIYGEDGVEITT